VSYLISAYAVTLGALLAYGVQLRVSARRLREEITRAESNRG